MIIELTTTNIEILPELKAVNLTITPKFASGGNIPTKTSQLENDSNFISDADYASVKSKAESALQELPDNLVIDYNYVHTDNNLTDGLLATINNAVQADDLTPYETIENNNTKLGGKVDKAEGYSLVLNTEIAKIHTRNTDSTLLSEDGTKSIYLDNAGVFHVGKISQSGESYETHAEQVFTTKNEIILRDGAIAGLAVGEYVGFRAKLYDGVNDGLLVYDKDGFARVGDVGALSRIATIQETPTNNQFTYYDSETLSLKTRTILASDIPTLAQSQIANLTADLSLLAPKLNPIFSGVVNADVITDSAGYVHYLGNTYYQTKYLTTLLVSTNGTAITYLNDTFFNTHSGNLICINGEYRILLEGVNGSMATTLNAPFSQNYTNQQSFQLYPKILTDQYGGTSIFNRGRNSIGINQYSQFTAGSWVVAGSGRNRINEDSYNLGDQITIRWGNGTDANSAKDLGLRRNLAGELAIYDGITATNYRDLRVRALTTNGGLQTFGANDSAGAGFRTVRVPNI